MKDTFNRLTSSVKEAAKKTSESVSDALEREETQAAIDWAKKTAVSAADEAARLGKEVIRSDLAKDAATGAAIGAALAIPVPLIGPAAGAVVGAGVGIYKNMTKPVASPTVLPKAEPPTESHQAMYDELIKLDDLRQKAILTEAEFDEQKKKILERKNSAKI